MTLEELKNALCEQGFEDSIVLENPSYLSAITGFTDNGHVIYDYDLMVKELALEYHESDPTRDIEDCYNDAEEFVQYNTVRAIPYMKSCGIEPLIKYSFNM